MNLCERSLCRMLHGASSIIGQSCDWILCDLVLSSDIRSSIDDGIEGGVKDMIPMAEVFCEGRFISVILEQEKTISL